jgi:hypothetical protein
MPWSTLNKHALGSVNIWADPIMAQHKGKDLFGLDFRFHKDDGSINEDFYNQNKTKYSTIEE